MKISSCIVIVVLALAVGTCGQIGTSLPALYQHWLDEDVTYIITDTERKDFIALGDDAARDEFIRNFWERRNPQPDKAENPFKEEHYRRIAFANEHFATDVPGWKTDRGKAYIQIGPPDSLESLTVNGVREEIWHYTMPAMESKPASLIFIDHCSCGDYKFEGWRR